MMPPVAEYRFTDLEAAKQAMGVGCPVCKVPPGELCSVVVGRKLRYHTQRYITAYRVQRGGPFK